MKYVLTVALATLISLSSCNKENSNESPPVQKETVLNYMPLAVGNYWVYQHYTCDSGELNCVEKSIDTSLITKDSLINGNLYYKMVGKSITSASQAVFLRDSGDYIVDASGIVFFTLNDTSNTFNHQYAPTGQPDTLFYWYFQLAQDVEVIDVPLGSYDCMDMRGHFYRHQDNFEIDHNTHSLYSKDVGMVKKTALFASNLSVLKQELVGYHIEPDGGVTP